MKAVQFSQHGDRSVLTYDDHPEPSVGDQEVMLEIKAAALNHLDVHTRRGVPGIDLSFPHIAGSDGAGVVTEVGDDVTRFERGDRVVVSPGRWCGQCEFCRHGEHSMCDSYHLIGEHVNGVQAERAAVPQACLIPVPDHVDWQTAGSVALAFQTAWRMLHSRADINAGDHVLVHGASGGVGHAAVQIAEHAGATVYATGSSDEKLDHARTYGADHAINYDEQSFDEKIYQLTDGRGVDVVVDHIGPATWDESLKSLTKGGTLVTCGATTGPIAKTNINRVFWKQLEIVGSTMATPGEADDVLELVWDGTFSVHLREILPMSEIQRAHQLLEDRVGFGKVVVVPDSEYDA
ncbi:zinc-binding dehydrogenase [Halocatena halophila]|uniref:zinc-binding dehydrogenase n=1 Tax=Halocatena halophila TaxID=2814576 RepID=UPI002ED41839